MQGFRFLLAMATACLTALLALGPTAAAQAKPQRIVSTNLCTDQLLMRLVEPERIVSLTHLAWNDGVTPPALRPALARARKNHGLAEEVLVLDPDLVVTGSFSARFSNDLLRRLGRNVVLFDPENSLADWYANVRRMGAAVGEPERAERLIADFQRRLAAFKAEIPPGPAPIYASLTPNAWMPGRNTLFTEIVNAGGFRTAGEALGFSGYRGVPLEQLIDLDIALISTNIDASAPASLARASLTHPLLRMLADKAAMRIAIPERYTVCPSPETLEMVRRLVAARKAIDARRPERAR